MDPRDSPIFSSFFGVKPGISKENGEKNRVDNESLDGN